MTTTTSSLSTRRSRAAASLDLIQVKPGLSFSKQTLVEQLPDVETTLFFAKLYRLDVHQLSDLLFRLFGHSDVLRELTQGDHSTELQDYLVELDFEAELNAGEITLSPNVPHGEILPAFWEDLEVEVATSIQEVADKMTGVLDKLPGKYGKMLFKTMAVMNSKRPVIGDYKATIQRTRARENLVVLDVSGSMTPGTIHQIVDDVVALSYKANAHLAIVSETCTYWEPGTYDSASVLQAAEFWGTNYETLEPLLQQDWGTVVTVADYDSSYSALEHLAANASCHIQHIVDISLVDRPTFLAQCLGQFADKVTPMLVGNSAAVLRA